MAIYSVSITFTITLGTVEISVFVYVSNMYWYVGRMYEEKVYFEDVKRRKHAERSSVRKITLNISLNAKGS